MGCIVGKSLTLVPSLLGVIFMNMLHGKRGFTDVIKFINQLTLN